MEVSKIEKEQLLSNLELQFKVNQKILGNMENRRSSAIMNTRGSFVFYFKSVTNLEQQQFNNLLIKQEKIRKHIQQIKKENLDHNEIRNIYK